MLKTHQLATEPISGSGLLQSRWFLMTLVQFELLLAFWLASGWLPGIAERVGLATFALFAIVAAAKGITGEADCGCFGRLATSPWFAFLIDLSAILGLSATSGHLSPRCLSSRKRGVTANARDPSAGSNSATTWRARLCLAPVWLVTAIAICFLGRDAHRSCDLVAVGERVGDAVIIEPDRMVGREFVLGSYIDIGHQLARGRWLVLLYRPGCGNCQLLMADWAGAAHAEDFGASTAFVSVSSDLAEAMPLQDVVWGRLALDTKWFVTTPTVLAIEDDTDNCGLNQCSTFCTSQGESREYLHTEVRGSTSGNDNIEWVTKPCYRVYQCVVGEDQSNRECYSIVGPPQSCYWLAWATCHGCAFSEGLTIGVQSCEIVSCGT